MSFFSALYRLLIGPLELFFEILFSMANRVIQHPGISIIFLSLAMNFLVLPLYRRADAMQEEERQTNERLKHWTAHIKKTFKGDERFMILQTYYRQNNYKPTDALKGSVSLLLEIPFFMAAYNFLSKLPLLHGASLGPIQNLGEPDGLLTIGGLAINLLPILMTAINLVSSAIYTKGLSTKSKVQLYVMAALFLILLYDSPSGLVFYWTLNNLFSLVKNIFYKLKNPRKVLCLLSSAVGAVALLLVIITHPMPTARSQILLCCLTLLLQLPLAACMLSQHLPHSTAEIELTRKDHATFWISGLFLTALTGIMIPTSVIHTSPEEFINAVTHTSPLLHILNSTLTAAGFFLVWFGIFYMLASNTGKNWMSYAMCALSIIAVVNYMFFGRDYGNMSANLVFDTSPAFSHQLLNLAVIALLAAAVYFLWKKKQELFRFIALTAAVGAMALSVVNMTQIHHVTTTKSSQLEQTATVKPTFHLSRHGKNVVVLMLDRAVGAYVPYMMNEKPLLQEQFAGFTYYPNTVSFGPCTNIGSPSLFGGYEYTPENMNQRDEETLEEKTNEALKVLPVSFLNAGYDVTVSDPPCAGYDWFPDLSIYADYPAIQAFNSMGSFDGLIDPVQRVQNIEARLMRNFFCYSLMKAAPVCLQPYLYSGGTYNDVRLRIGQVVNANATAAGLNTHLIHSYEVLNQMIRITHIDEGSKNTFMMMANDTTHEPMLLQKPDYIPAETVDNREYDSTHPVSYTINGTELKMESEVQVTHYHVNMAAFLKLGQWFDYLRSEGVYDNTRIIMVADHGAIVNQIENMQFGENWNDDVLSYNPLLMVKDFDSTEYTVDSRFMTNADTAYLAMHGIFETPTNPFTHQAIGPDAKASSPQHVFCSHDFSITTNSGNTFHPGPWYSVHDDIFNMDNWEYLGEH